MLANKDVHDFDFFLLIYYFIEYSLSAKRKMQKKMTGVKRET